MCLSNVLEVKSTFSIKTAELKKILIKKIHLWDTIKPFAEAENINVTGKFSDIVTNWSHYSNHLKLTSAFFDQMNWNLDLSRSVFSLNVHYESKQTPRGHY